MTTPQTCTIEGCDKKVRSRGLCGSHYNKWNRENRELVRAYAKEDISFPEASSIQKAPSLERGPDPLWPTSRRDEVRELESLKELGLYTAHDISKWCARSGIQSAYLEYQKEELYPVEYSQSYYTSRFLVRDSQKPGKILKKFEKVGDSSLYQTMLRAQAWYEAKYDTPVEYVDLIRSSIPSVAVDLLLDELALMRKLFSEDADEIPLNVLNRFMADYPVVEQRYDQKVRV